MMMKRKREKKGLLMKVIHTSGRKNKIDDARREEYKNKE